MPTFLLITLAPYSEAFKNLSITNVNDLEFVWNQGYDFKIHNGCYCSNRDIDEMKKWGCQGVIIKAPDGTTKQIKF